jgi:hypothetical protein
MVTFVDGGRGEPMWYDTSEIFGDDDEDEEATQERLNFPPMDRKFISVWSPN